MAGKYASTRDEELHGLVIGGMSSDTVGDVQTWGCIYDGLAGLDADALARNGLSGVVPAGKWWIVCENSDGFVTVDQLDSAQEYAAAIASLEAEFDAFENQ
ncbi:MAG: hypothetical protein WAV90_13825 [Gordonia amarae]